MKQTPFQEGKYYHIFNRGNNKENLFIEERNYLFFLEKLKNYILPISNILGYCLLPNHFHLVLQIKELDQLPIEYQTGKKRVYQPFSNLFNSYTKSINKAYNRTGSLFQEHLHRIEITDNKYLRDVIIYTHLNPVNHGFVKNLGDYAYSSYNSILSNSVTNLDKNAVLNLFGGVENFQYCHKIRKIKNQEKLKEIESIDI